MIRHGEGLDPALSVRGGWRAPGARRSRGGGCSGGRRSGVRLILGGHCSADDLEDGTASVGEVHPVLLGRQQNPVCTEEVRS